MADELEPASFDDLRIILSLALTRGDRLARAQSADAMAGVTSERLVEAIKNSGYVVMRKPTPPYTTPGQFDRPEKSPDA